MGGAAPVRLEVQIKVSLSHSDIDPFLFGQAVAGIFFVLLLFFFGEIRDPFLRSSLSMVLRPFHLLPPKCSFVALLFGMIVLRTIFARQGNDRLQCLVMP
jgi:hypothetical protein